MQNTAINSEQGQTHIGEEMYNFISELYPINRSITGNGFRETMERIRDHIPLTVHEVQSGRKVFDWTVPKEWNINDAYVKNSSGKKVIDFKKSNLHILAYSVPVNRKVTLNELKEHLFTIPEHPDWIPYRYSYYKENWGFCLSYNDYKKLNDKEYEVYIDSSLEDGSMTYGEYYIKGELTDEVLISCTACHPSLCNDNLSGIALTTFLAKQLNSYPLRYSYRFLFLPAAIGPIAWLCNNEPITERIKHGVVLVCAGDPGNSTYKKSRIGNAEIDRAFEHILKQSGQDYSILEFVPYGYEERQYCSPGFNLPVGCLMRTPHDCYPEYHTSADNLDLVKPEYLADSYFKCLSAFNIIEHNNKYLNLNPKCEPQLGKRGLYRQIAGEADSRNSELPMLWVLNYSDGNHSLLDIAEKSNISFEDLKRAVEALSKSGLLEKISE